MRIFRHDPQLPMLPENQHDADSVDNNETAAALARLQRAARKLDDTLADNARLQASLTEAEREIAFLRKQISACDKRAALHQRHSIALHTRMEAALPLLKAYEDYLLTALEEARVEAMAASPPPATDHHAIDLDEAARAVERAVNTVSATKEESK